MYFQFADKISENNKDEASSVGRIYG